MAATSRRSSEATFNWSGRGGVVKKFLGHTTPSAQTNGPRDFFFIVQPPLPLSYANKLIFISISWFLLFEFPNGEAIASRASRQHLSFREVEFLLTAF